MDPEQRRRLMARFKSANTKPEMAVRRLLHRLGYRFRIHRKDLPGRPDIVLPRYRTAIFVHGCFWHRHAGCKVATFPKSQPEFWRAKFDNNVERDAANTSRLEALGWRVLVVWECETRDAHALEVRLTDALPRPLPPACHRPARDAAR